MQTLLRGQLDNPDSLDKPDHVEVVCLVPAHNEEEQIAATIESLLAQTIPVKIIVSADNCTDRTVEIARSYPGVIVRQTVENSHKKAGALNQAWHAYGARCRLRVHHGRRHRLAPDCLENSGDGLGDTRRRLRLAPAQAAHHQSAGGTAFMYRLIRLEFGSSADEPSFAASTAPMSWPASAPSSRAQVLRDHR